MLFKAHSNKIIFLFAILLAAFFHFDSMNEYPMYIHTWAQSDRFALALNFFWNDFNLLKAETYLMNLQFPANYLDPKEDSITMVNLPFHEYFIALLMKVFNTKEPIVFRLYQFVWSLIGLKALLKIATQLGLNSVNRAIAVLFIITAPLFVYYQNNFLPSISSFSLCLLAIYYYLNYTSNRKVGYFYFSILLFVLAGIYRNTFVIPLVAILGLEFLRFIKGKVKLLHLCTVSILVGMIFYLQNSFQMNQVESYGSVFQYYLTPPKSWDHVVSITQRIFDRWIFEYFSIAHYCLMGILILAMLLISLIFSKVKTKKNQELINISLIYPLGALFGCFLFYLVMYPKLYDHDYYIMDTLYIPIVLLVLFSLSYLQKHLNKTITIGLLIVFGIPAIILAKNNLDQRRTSPSWDYSLKTFNDLNGIDSTLDSLGIDRTKKILTIGSHYSNLPFILMDRKGYIVNHLNKSSLKEIVRWKYDYILLHNILYKQSYYSSYPELLGRVKKLYSNNLYTICKLQQQDTVPSLVEFFSPDLSDLYYEQKIDFEREKVHLWSKLNRTKQDKYSGEYAGQIKASDRFGLSFKLDDHELNDGKTHLANITMKVKSTERLRNLNLVVDLIDDGKKTLYQVAHLKEAYTNRGDWQEINFQYTLPKMKSNNAKISIYFWNPGKQNALIDDFELSIY